MNPDTLTFTVSLDKNAYRHALYWNLFCKSKKSTGILLFLFGCSFFTISYSFLLYTTDSVMFFVTLVPALLCMCLPLYFIIRLEKQIKAKAKTIPVEEATKKEIQIDARSISIFQAAGQTATHYTWQSVQGVYPAGEDLMLYMNDGQIIVMKKEQTPPGALQYVTSLAGQNNRLKKGLKTKTVLYACALIAAAGIYLIIHSVS